MDHIKKWLAFILIVGFVALVAVPSFLAVRNRDYQARAKDVLSRGATAAEEYASDHEGDYRGMTAANLHGQYESGVRFADGTGGIADTVYISGLGEDTYILTVKARDGSVYTANKAPGGSIKYDY